jgi:hypothetical protein
MDKIPSLNRNLVLITTFGIAMGALEAIVVVYLRMLYYPDGFEFPMKLIDPAVYGVEVLRELATLVMLFSIAWLVGKSFYERLAYFLLAFAVWDVFYYFWLKVLLDWPATLLDWDILFLIPITWVGPVLSPLICCLIMTVMSGVILFFIQQGIKVKFRWHEWLLVSAGALIIFYTYIRDYLNLLIEGGYLSNLANLSENLQFRAIVLSYIPTLYSWGIFVLGISLILLANITFWRRVRTPNRLMQSI